MTTWSRRLTSKSAGLGVRRAWAAASIEVMVVFDGVRGGWQADVLMVVCCVWKSLPTVTVGVRSSNSGNNRLVTR